MRGLQLNFAISCTALWLLGCEAEVREPPACAQSRQQARELLRAQKLDEARTELGIARKACSHASAWDVDRMQDLLGLQEKQRRTEAERLQKEALLNAQQPLRAFMLWARSVLQTNKERLGAVTCAPRGNRDFGFCTGIVARPTGTPFVVRYLANNPEAFRLEWDVPIPVSCVDLGPHRAGLKQKAKNGDDLFLCELTDHAFTGLTGLVRVAGNSSHVVLFPDRYPDADPEFRKLIGENP